MAEDTVSGWVLTELEDGKQALVATPYHDVVIEVGRIVSLVALDMDAYAGSMEVRQ